MSDIEKLEAALAIFERDGDLDTYLKKVDQINRATKFRLALDDYKKTGDVEAYERKITAITKQEKDQVPDVLKPAEKNGVLEAEKKLEEKLKEKR